MRDRVLAFESFRQGPGGQICRQLGLDIDVIQTWHQLRTAAVAFNGDDLNAVATRGAPYVTRARRLAGVASSGELALICAILGATDYAAQADELSPGRAWQMLDGLDDAHRAAVAACVAQID